MGLLKNLIVGKEYEPGGKHHVRITNDAFDEAVEIIKNLTQEQKQDFINEIVYMETNKIAACVK